MPASALPAADVAARDATHTVIVLAKSPRPGHVKTRLSPDFSPGEAAALAQAAIIDTFDAVTSIAVRSTAVWEGTVPRWLPESTAVLPQRGDGLAERITNAFLDVMAGSADQPTLLIGMDTPQVAAADLLIDWSGCDAVLGLTADGGYWAIGFRRFDSRAVRGIPMSTPETGELQLRRLRELGLRVQLLAPMRDVDTASDASAVAALAPHTRFGRLHRRLVDRPTSPVSLFDAALSGTTITATTSATIAATALAADRLRATTTAADEVLLSRCEAPVLDLGCGPGRMVESLAARGVTALGVDVSSAAVAQTAARGASALRRAVDERLPAEGRWGTVLLADGNIGMGGDPKWLLERCYHLVRDGGIVLVEADADDDADTRLSVTLHTPDGRRSTPVPWARVGLSAIIDVASALGFVAVEEWRVDARVFVALRRLG